MKAGQFSNEQIVAILQEAEKGEKPILEICKGKGITRQAGTRRPPSIAGARSSAA
jgi:hypothetical protein